ncbi:MAG: Ig-like domain-containing protein [Gemmatimonadota bacterium]
MLIDLRIARRARVVAVVSAGVVAASALLPSRGSAQGAVAVNVSDSAQISVVRNKTLRIPIVLVPTGGIDIASFQGDITFGTARLRFDSLTTGPFGVLTPNTSNAASGALVLNATRASGQPARDTIANLYFTADNVLTGALSFAQLGGSRVSARPTAATNGAAANILASVFPRQLDVCVVTGVWGDVNDDGGVNVIDAQQIARYSVGLSVLNDSAVIQRGDVTASNSVDIIDAQQIARYSVGLSAAARINTPAFLPAAVASMTASPGGTQNVAVGGTLQLTADPTNATGASVSGCALVSWSTSDAGKATVSASGLVTGVGNGSAVITATSGAKTATVTVNVGPVNGGTVSAIEFVNGASQYGYTNATVPVEMRAVNATGGTVPGATITLSLTSGPGTLIGPSGTTATVNVVSDANGLATATFSTTTAGASVLNVSAAGITPVTASVTAITRFIGQHICMGNFWSIRCWGNNSLGQLGDGTTSNSLVPVNVNLSGIALALPQASVTVSPQGIGDHTCLLDDAGKAYCWGSNTAGQLGDGTQVNRNNPTAVNTALRFTAIATGSEHTCALTSGGEMYCWGSNFVGQIGDGTRANIRPAPTRVSAAAGVTFVSIALGSQHSCAIGQNVVTYCWGSNASGQLGDGTLVDRAAPTVVTGSLALTTVSAGDTHTCGLTAAGAAFCWGARANGALGDGGSTSLSQPTPVAVANNHVFQSIHAGWLYTCGAKANGEVWCWGANFFGRFGDGTTTATYTVPTFIPFNGHAIRASGWNNTLSAITTCGLAAGTEQVLCWGRNSQGFVGDGTTTDRLLPTVVAQAGAAVGAFGALRPVLPLVPPSATKGSAVADNPTILLRDRLGNPIAGATIEFFVTSGGGTIANATTTTDGSGQASGGTWTLGPNAGINRLTARVAITGPSGASGYTSYVFVAFGTNVAANISIFAGNNQVQRQSLTYPGALTVLVTDAASVPIPNVQITFAVASGGGFVSNSAGASSSSATLLTDANGLARTLASAPGVAQAQTITATGAGLSAVTFNLRSAPLFNNGVHCELTSAGAAYCWGSNDHGQVGDGTTTTPRVLPTAVTGGVAFTSLADGVGDHMCGLTVAGVAWCWGSNAFGQLGDNTTTDRPAPTQVGGGLTFTKLVISFTSTCGRTSAGALYCWGGAGNGIYGDGAIGIVRMLPTAATVGGLVFSDLAMYGSVSGSHLCGIATGGAAYCWGLNDAGQLGDGSFTNRTAPAAVAGGLAFTKISAGDRLTCGLVSTGQVHCWGLGISGQMGNGTTSSSAIPVTGPTNYNFVAFSTSGATSCGINNVGAAYCWGAFASGQGGDGTTVNKSSPTRVEGSIAFGALRLRGATSCGRAAGGSAHVYCWGNNVNGQVGDNSVANRTTPTATTWPEGVAGAAVSVVVSADNPAGYPGSAAWPAPSVLVRDYVGNPVSGVSVTFTVKSGGGSVTGSTAVTDANGIATVGSWILGGAASQTLSATAAGLSAAIFSANPIAFSETTIASLYRTIWGATAGCNNCINTQAHAMALENYSELSNFSMKVRSVIPRTAIGNDAIDSSATANYSTFRALADVARAAAYSIQTVNSIAGAGGGTNTAFGSKAQDARGRAFAFFNAGWALGSLALAFDSSAIVTPASPSGVNPPLSGYRDVSDAAIRMLDSAIAWATSSDITNGANGFPLPSSWINGNPLSQAQFVALVRSHRARIRAGVSRSPAERAAVNWGAVVADAQNGIASDFQLSLSVSAGWSGTLVFDTQQMYSSAQWHQLSMLMFGMADTTGAYASYLASPLSTRDGMFLVRTPDLRFPQGASRAAQQADTPTPLPAGRYIRNRSAGEDIFNSASYSNSFYDFRRWQPISGSGNGQWTQMSKVENDMLAAEGMIRTGNYPGAAVLINASRSAHGLPVITAFNNSSPVPGGNACVPKIPLPPSYNTAGCGNMFEALKWEKRMETLYSCSFMCWFTDSRGWGDLPEGTPVHWPVPYQELDARGKPRYQMAGSTNKGAYGW